MSGITVQAVIKGATIQVHREMDKLDALGVLPDGTRDILGLWIENTEGAKFWMKVFNDLKTRGLNDILIALTDGLKGRAERWEQFILPQHCKPASCT